MIYILSSSERWAVDDLGGQTIYEEKKAYCKTKIQVFLFLFLFLPRTLKYWDQVQHDKERLQIAEEDV